MDSFDGKVIAITGAASGIGLATAKLLSSRGATLALADTNEAALENAAKSFLGDGKHTTEVVDVSDSAQVDSWIARTVSTHGKLDGAVNVAGVIRAPRPIKDETNENWELINRVNASGVFYCLRAELNSLKDRGSIVSAASVGGQQATRGLAAYCASKHAVIGLTRVAARENPGIRVNAIAPGAVDTPMLTGLEQHVGAIQPPEAGQCMDRKADPSEVAKVILFLLSDDASFVTGAVYNVDGGLFC